MIANKLIVAILLSLVMPLASPMPSCAEGPVNLDQMLSVRTFVGALVVEVEPGATAARSGLSAGDVLGSVDGQMPYNLLTLEGYVGALRESAMLRGAVTEVWRLDRNSGILSRTSLELKLPAGIERFGMVLIPVLFFREVAPGGPAERAGIRAWDSIEKIGVQRIADISRFDEIEQIAASQRSGGRLPLTVGHWKPSQSIAGKQLLEGLREIVVAIP